MIKKGNLKIERLDPELQEKMRFKVSDGTIGYDQLQNMFPMYSRREKNDIMIFFDDCITFTTLGFLDFMNKTVFKQENFCFYADSFFRRNNEYLDGIKFAQAVLKKNTGYNFAIEELEATLKDNYGKILQHSPSSGILLSLSGGGKCISNLYFVFKHDFDYMDYLVDSIKKDLFKFDDFNIHYTHLDNKKDTDLILEYKPNCIFGGNTGVYYDLAITNELKGVEFFTNFAHNGFCEEFLDKWVNNPVNTNPLGHKIYFYDDQLINHEDEIDEDDLDGQYNEYLEEE